MCVLHYEYFNTSLSLHVSLICQLPFCFHFFAIFVLFLDPLNLIGSISGHGFGTTHWSMVDSPLGM